MVGNVLNTGAGRRNGYIRQPNGRYSLRLTWGVNFASKNESKMLTISPGSSVPASGSNHLLLAGGGHRPRWCSTMGHEIRGTPDALITLINDTREALFQDGAA